MDKESILLAFAVVTGLAVVVQTILLLAVFLALRKGALAIKGQVEELHAAALPIIRSTQELCSRLAPKIESTLERVETTVDDLSDITRALRNQTLEVKIVTQEIVERVRRQTGRVDHMFSNVLDAVEHAGDFVANVVSKPVRQVNGVVASVKAIVDSLRASETRPVHNRSPRG